MYLSVVVMELYQFIVNCVSILGILLMTSLYLSIVGRNSDVRI